VIITALLGICFLNLTVNLMSIRRLPRSGSLKEWPVVSILLPARNERKRIQACLESLARQDYPDYEVLVLDNSDDDTGEIAGEVARQYRHVRVIKGLPQPPDWAGKNFACHQLSKQARGQWLLFVDADTVHKPGMLRGAISLANSENASLLSGFPHQITSSLAQQIIVPAFYFILLSWVPFWIPFRPGKSRANFAIGQFMLFSSSEYRRIGGHELIKTHLLDDVWLAIETGKAGGKVVTADLSKYVSCHMYETVMDMWNGFGKSIYSVIALSPLGILAAAALGFCLWVLPFLNLWNRWDTDVVNGQFAGILIAMQVALILIPRWVIDIRMRASWYSAIFQPLGIIFYMLEVICMSVRRLAGTGVRWKDCFYSSRSGVE